MLNIRFGTDGWRGGIAEEYTFENVRYCAQGTADYLISSGQASKGMIVGYDMRFRSEDFAAAVAEVLAGNGIRTYLSKIPAPTPVLSYAILPYSTAGGIWITASHNPPSDNGFKLRSAYAGAADPQTLTEVEHNISRAQAASRIERMDYGQAVKQGLIQPIDPTEPYIEQLGRLIDTAPLVDHGLRVVADPMWGVGQGWFPRLLCGGKTTVKEIHNERNPLFPRMRRPEPIEDNLTDLLATVLAWQGDVGLATDGDADRVGLVNEKGVFINQLQVYALLALYLLEMRGWRGPLVRTVSSTVMADKLAQRYQVPVHRTRVGFKYVAPKMIEVDAILGGEESGGFAFRGHIPERDGILAGLYLLDLMVRLGKSPSQLVDHLFSLIGAHYYDRIDYRMAPEEKPVMMARIQDAKPARIAGLKVLEIEPIGTEGFLYHMDDTGWVLLRFSGTEPLIRAYCETMHADKVQDLLAGALGIAGLSV